MFINDIEVGFVKNGFLIKLPCENQEETSNVHKDSQIIFCSTSDQLLVEIEKISQSIIARPL